jgi:DNA-binding NtrC family response regulator
VELPPLRARPQDILPLAEHFLAASGDGVVRVLAADARAALLAHSWPGNARELRHVVQLAAVLSDTQIIRKSALRFEGAAPWEPHCADAPEQAGLALPPPEPEGALALPRVEPEGAGARPRLDRDEPLAPAEVIDLRGQTLAALEESAIRAAHERHGGNRRGMAAELGIARSSLIRKLDLLGLRERRDHAGAEQRDDAGAE